MILPLVVLIVAVALAFAAYAALHHRLGWVEIWTPAKGVSLRPFADLIPLEDIQNSLYVLTDGSLVGGWELNGIDPAMKPDDVFGIQVRRLNFALNALNPSTEAIIQVRRTNDVSDLLRRFDEASSPQTPERLFLKRRWRRQLHDIARSKDMPFLDTRIYVFLRVAAEKKGRTPGAVLAGLLRRVGRGFDPEREAGDLRREYLKKVQFFEDETRGFTAALGNTSYQPRRLTNTDLDHYAKSLLWSSDAMANGYTVSRRPDPNKFVLADVDGGTRRTLVTRDPSLAQYFPRTLRAQIASVYYDAYPDYVKLDGRFIGVMRMTMAPDSVREDLLQFFRAQLQFPCCYTARIRPKAKQAELDRMRREAEVKMVQANTRQLGSPGPDAQNVKNYQEAQQRYEDMLSPDRNPFGVEITFTFEAESEQEVRQRAEVVSNYFLALNDCRVTRERYGADRVFRESLPFVVPADNPRMVLATDEVSCLLPVFTPWRGAATPVRIFRSASGEPWAWDPWDLSLENRNQAHWGRTGSGKGFIGQTVSIYPTLVRGGVDYLIVDSAGTYKRAAEVLNGAFFEASDKSKEAINALAVPPSFYTLPEDEAAEYLRAHVATNVSLVTVLAEPQEQQKATWNTIISDVVNAELRRGVADRREVLLRQIYTALLQYSDPSLPEREIEAKRVAANIRKYIHDPDTGAPGQYAKLFDRARTFDPDTDFLVVDLNRIKNESPTVLTAFLIVVVAGIFFQRAMRNRARTDGRATRVLGDEIAGYATNPIFAREFMRIYREARKLRLGGDCMWQAYSDSNLPEFRAFAQPLKEASGTNFFLAHKRTAGARETFEGDGLGLLAERLFELQMEAGVYSEIVVQQSGENYAQIVVQPDPFETWLATTNPADTQIEDAYAKRYGHGTPWGLTRFDLTYLLSRLWPYGSMKPATVTGIAMDRFPPDQVVRHFVQECRTELEDCRKELIGQGVWDPSKAAGPVIQADPDEPPTSPAAAAAPARPRRSLTLAALQGER